MPKQCVLGLIIIGSQPVLANCPAVSHGHPQVHFLGGQTVLQQVPGFYVHQRCHNLGGQVRCAMAGVLAGLHHQAEGCEQEVHQLWGVGVMDVGLQLCLEEKVREGRSMNVKYISIEFNSH